MTCWRRTWLPVIAWMLCTLIAPWLRAEEPAHEEKKAGNLINELFVGEKLYIQEKNEWYFIVEGEFAKNGDEKEYEPALEVRYSFTDELQLSAELPYVIVDADDTHHGVGDVTLALNYNFVQREDFSLALRTAFILPTGDENRDLGSGEFTFEPELLAAVRVGRGEIYAGVGADFGDDTDRFLYSLAGAYPLADQWAGIVEFSGVSGDHTDVAYITPGISWEVSPHLTVQAGVPIGVTDDSDDFQIITKLVFEY